MNFSFNNFSKRLKFFFIFISITIRILIIFYIIFHFYPQIFSGNVAYAIEQMPVEEPPIEEGDCIVYPRPSAEECRAIIKTWCIWFVGAFTLSTIGLCTYSYVLFKYTCP